MNPEWYSNNPGYYSSSAFKMQKERDGKKSVFRISRRSNYVIKKKSEQNDN